MWVDDIYQYGLPENSVSFQIFFRDNSYKEVRQIRAYKSKDLFADVGGINGFYLGYALVQVPYFISTMCLMLQSMKQIISNTFLSKKFLEKRLKNLWEYKNKHSSGCEAIRPTDIERAEQKGKKPCEATIIQVQ